jgi:dihydrofolate reductase
MSLIIPLAGPIESLGNPSADPREQSQGRGGVTDEFGHTRRSQLAMRRLFLQINVSLDGFIADANREIDWHFADDEFEEFINDTLRSIDAMVFGRVAYELLAEFWPAAASDPEASARQLGRDPRRHAETARLMNELPKFVVSNQLERVTWQNSHIIRGDVAAEINRLKQQPGRDIALFAGAQTASTFTQLGLIDEYRFILNPVLLGAGKPLFTDGYAKTNLSLRKTRPFASGAVVLIYEPEETPWVA